MRTKSLIPDGGIIKVVTLLGALMLFMIVSAAQAKIIYYDNFDGLSGVDLDGTTPDITTGGETWLAGSNFGADGTITFDNSSMGDSAEHLLRGFYRSVVYFSGRWKHREPHAGLFW